MNRTLPLLLLALGLFLFLACDPDECAENETQCAGGAAGFGYLQIQTCVGGSWEAPVDCPGDQICYYAGSYDTNSGTILDIEVDSCVVDDAGSGDDDDSAR